MTQKQAIGKIGEDIAARYLIRHKHRIIDRNFYCRYGEIDIVSIRNKTLFFWEVKTGISKDKFEIVYNVDYFKQAKISNSMYEWFNRKENIEIFYQYKLKTICINMYDKIYIKLYNTEQFIF